MKNLLKALPILSVFLFTNAYASLMNVSDIKITNAIGTVIQVTEVFAKESITGIDLASLSAGATATASSSYPGTSPSLAIDDLNAGGGHFTGAGEYHSATPGSFEFLNISLAVPSSLDEITIFGRSDCCIGRDIYNLFIYDDSSNLIFSASNLDATGSTHSVTVNFATVPEPSIIALFGLGLVGLGFARRSRRA